MLVTGTVIWPHFFSIGQWNKDVPVVLIRLIQFSLQPTSQRLFIRGFGQVLKSDPRVFSRGFAARVSSRPSAEHVSVCGRRNEAPRRTREKTSGTQGRRELASSLETEH